MAPVTPLVQRLRRLLGRLARAVLPWSVTPGAASELATVRAELAATRRRLADLEKQVQETRRLHQRVAELTDVVAEILVPAADRDDARLRAALEGYTASTF